MGVGEDLERVCEYVVEKIILEVLSGERVTVRVFEGDDLLLLRLLVSSGGCSGHRWSSGGDAVVVVVNSQTCPNREESDRQPLRSFIILVTTSCTRYNFPFPLSHSPFFFFRPPHALFPMARDRISPFLPPFFLLALILTVFFLLANHTAVLSDSPVELASCIIFSGRRRFLRLCWRSCSMSDRRAFIYVLGSTKRPLRPIFPEGGYPCAPQQTLSVEIHGPWLSRLLCSESYWRRPCRCDRCSSH